MWYEDDSQYVVEDGLAERTWPATLGLVHVFKNIDGDLVTTNGWGANQFWENHSAGKFAPAPYLRRFQFGRAFGIIMRSVPYVCVDIDGKNGGIQASRILMLPPTLAEKSKSGNGYHLFYRVPDAQWLEPVGYAEYNDSNGIIPGVDIRATGIVYHYPSQRWNTNQIANIPLSLKRLLDSHETSRKNRLEQARKILTGEDAELEADELMIDLQSPIPQGKRNTWLFAWGCRAARYVPNWHLKLVERAVELGLSSKEAVGIAESVIKYGIPEDSDSTV